MKILLVAIFALALNPPSHAHVPTDCKPLFTKAAKEVQLIVNKGQETSDMALDGLDPGWERRYPHGRYERLADLLAQLMGNMTFGFAALTDAIQCADSG